MVPLENNSPCLNRRQFLIVTAATAVAAGCQSLGGGGNSTAAQGERVIDAGPVTNYAADRIYDRFRDLGFFVVRQGDQLFVLSSFCTHRKCKLNAQRGHGFSCPCHGSTFTPEGKVTEGPAKIDLPHLSTVTDQNGHLLVTISPL